jgi:hypothetical protein
MTRSKLEAKISWSRASADFISSAAPQNFDAWRTRLRQALMSLTGRFAPSSPLRERELPRAFESPLLYR